MPDSTKLKVARSAIKFTARRSVGFVVSSIVKGQVPAVTPLQRVGLTVGSYVIGGMASDKAADWAEKEFDDAVGGALAFKKIIDDKRAAKKAE